MVKPAAGHRPLAYSSPEAVQTTGTVAPDEAPEPRRGRQALRLLDDGLLAATRHLAPVYDLYRRRIAQFQIEAPPQNLGWSLYG